MSQIKLKEIYGNNFEKIENPNTFELYFDNNYNSIPIKESDFNSKLIYNLLINTDEVNFAEVYGKLNNIGLEFIDYLNHILFDFTMKINDDRVKLWIVWLTKDYKEINFIVWYLQYKVKKNLLFSVDNAISINDVPNFDFTNLNHTLEYLSAEDKKLKNLFTKNKRGLSLL